MLYKSQTKKKKNHRQTNKLCFFFFLTTATAVANNMKNPKKKNGAIQFISVAQQGIEMSRERRNGEWNIRRWGRGRGGGVGKRGGGCGDEKDGSG